MTMQVGYPGWVPVAIVEKASTPQQRTITGTVSTIADIAERQKAVRHPGLHSPRPGGESRTPPQSVKKQL
jgi:siroheme synthase